MRSSKDAPSHTKLKFRAGAQVIPDKKAQLRASLKKLEEAEQQMKKGGSVKPHGINDQDENKNNERFLLQNDNNIDLKQISSKYDDDSDSENDNDNANANEEAAIDDAAIDAGSDLDSDSDSDSDLDSDDDEDEEAALQAELAKIRAEREEVKQKQEQREAAEEEAKLSEAALTGNPLLASGGAGTGAGGGGGKMKRKWNDDVVFRNQSRSEPDANKARFINDTVRNDFHKNFMSKFMQ